MEIEPAWYEYATFDEDGFVNGIAEDAPEDAKEAYREEQKRKAQYMERGEPIPR